jgi:iron-sulfur cluster assembly protein
MITVTDLAAGQLRALLQKRNMPDYGLRLFVQVGGCAGLQYGMAFEQTAGVGDTVVEVEGVRLFVDPVSATYLRGACIDYEDSAVGSGFRVDNPNAVAVCACGSSFRTEGNKEVERNCEP